MKVLFYARHNSGDWFRYLASRLSCASSTVIVSDTAGEGDVDLTPSFYRALDTTDTARVALAELGEAACDDVIARCRRPQLELGARGWAFELLRRWRRNPLDFRYLATWAHVDEYRLGFGDWAVVRQLDRRWREKLDAVPFERRVFVGLQYNPEGT